MRKSCGSSSLPLVIFLFNGVMVLLRVNIFTSILHVIVLFGLLSIINGVYMYDPNEVKKKLNVII